MKRGALGASSRPTRLARTYWIPCAFEVHVVHQPSTTTRPHHVDRQHLVACRPLQLDPERAQIVVPGHEQGPFDDAISAMLEILLNDRDAPAQDFVVHPARGVAVATLLRKQVVQVHALRLGREGREQKAQALYGFLISARA